ncbi:hypothetical protein P43SY_008764 [Pythium insidiosum]|uniref:Uncharacterized protein n=1 Tax=Pythium insidiosum TaxID=114742 RepID=A0AAD5LAD8_PYTIN|nr:hypothetical protein P43SY_008764 [Pythium insidiosum]
MIKLKALKMKCSQVFHLTVGTTKLTHIQLEEHEYDYETSIAWTVDQVESGSDDPVASDPAKRHDKLQSDGAPHCDRHSDAAWDPSDRCTAHSSATQANDRACGAAAPTDRLSSSGSQSGGIATWQCPKRQEDNRPTVPTSPGDEPGDDNGDGADDAADDGVAASDGDGDGNDEPDGDPDGDRDVDHRLVELSRLPLVGKPNPKSLSLRQFTGKVKPAATRKTSESYEAYAQRMETMANALPGGIEVETNAAAALAAFVRMSCPAHASQLNVEWTQSQRRKTPARTALHEMVEFISLLDRSNDYGAAVITERKRKPTKQTVRFKLEPGAEYVEPAWVTETTKCHGCHGLGHLANNPACPQYGQRKKKSPLMSAVDDVIETDSE